MGLEGRGDDHDHSAQQQLAHALEKLKIDPAILDPTDPEFVVDAEFRPNSKHNEFSGASTQQIPLIDLRPLRENDEEGIKKVVGEIGSAAENWGFFQVVNHGVPLSLVDTLEREALAFFSLPVEEKKKVSRTSTNPSGYFNREYTKERRDWKEVFDMKIRTQPVQPSSDPNSAFLNGFNLENQWPQQSAGLRDALEKYAKATEALAFDLLKLITRSLGLPAEHLMPFFEPDNVGMIRLNYYPPCPIPDLALGVSRHKDGVALTVLVQDETGGLQVLSKDEEWIGVTPRRDAFVINLGDLFQVWSNDKYRSVEHRVVVNENKARFSFPLFLAPALTTDICPVPELLHGKLPRYSQYNYGDFGSKRVAGSMKQLGRNLQIDDFAINRD